ncbi:organomercurial lyase [Corynebacterium sp.]|uniref:organomercurial lyase n=1 Tax=Corynebacterium sp. TaxID=1720 RepID=UPI0026DB4421|nr:organomercurial lyase [Corynebacterium sp.]MDO4610625.1 organomercurial lyase [Corynebacterium sp.]
MRIEDHPAELAHRLDRAFGFTSPDAADTWLALVRELACGRPVDPAELGTGADEIIAGFPGTEWSGGEVEGSIITLHPTTHSITHAGGTAYAWSAFGALLAGVILDGPVEIRSTCPATGEDVTVTVSGGVLLDGRAGIVSLPTRFRGPADIRGDFAGRALLWSRRPNRAGRAAVVAGTGHWDVAWYRPADAMAVVRETARLLGLSPWSREDLPELHARIA